MHQFGEFIDFSCPVCIMQVAVMHFVEAPECYRPVDEYKDRMAPGSYLILPHSTADFLSPAEAATIAREYDGSNARIFLRDKQGVSRFFGRLTLLDPGITDVAVWRAGPVEAQRTMIYGGAEHKRV